MDRDIAKIILLDAVRVLKLELKDFGNSVGERAIMFRLAHHIAEKFEVGELRVDCEYNRHIDDAKKFGDFRTRKRICTVAGQRQGAFFLT